MRVCGACLHIQAPLNCIFAAFQQIIYKKFQNDISHFSYVRSFPAPAIKVKKYFAAFFSAVFDKVLTSRFIE